MSIENTGYDEETNVITLSDEDGNDVEFEFLDLLEYEGKEYIVLLPPDDDSVVILEIQSDENSETENYIGIEDEQLLMKLFGVFKEKNADFFDFED
ncbi:MAG: DUF1292 domain-containing protein [Clostridia bacterium]|nr:DUF1292 domain-containing protein [Clostridia bacterium]